MTTPIPTGRYDEPGIERTELVDWVQEDRILMMQLLDVDHDHVRRTAVHAAMHCAATGTGIVYLAPGDATRYCATVIDQRHPLVNIMYPERDGPRERYMFSFGTEDNPGRADFDLDRPPYLPTDHIVERIAGAHSHTQVVCWVWLTYFAQALNPTIRAPWLAEDER